MLILTRGCVKRHGSSQDEEQGNHKDKTRHAVTRKECQTGLEGEKANHTQHEPTYSKTHISKRHMYTQTMCVCESTGVDLKRDTPNQTMCKLCFSLGRAKNVLVKGDFHTLSASVIILNVLPGEFIHFLHL